MALTPQDIEVQHAARAAGFVRDLERDIDRALSNDYRPQDKNTVTILVDAYKWAYLDVATKTIGLYFSCWTIDVGRNYTSTHVRLTFTPK